MQWGFAFLLTFSYMFKTRSIAAKQAADAAKSNKVESSFLISADSDVEAEAPRAGYFNEEKPTAMI